ncbi:IBR finger domain protein [Apiospora rasikravindrae]|uniref:RBR-type E3 ubiquitin transferase n=1 Tax=Apiospora rasikravindrae TaxID=990691 RepID=A0ABR1SDP6_9PEZI
MAVASLTQCDDAHLALIIQLQLEEVEEARCAAAGKGKQPEGSQTDQQMTFELFLRELQDIQSFTADCRMARSIQQAVLDDGDALVRYQSEERVADEDRHVSVSLSDGEAEPSQTVCGSGALAEDEDFLEKLACIYITGVNDDGNDDGARTDETETIDQPESSTWATLRQPKAKHRQPCDACREPKHFAELATAPCRHEYCRQCLTHLFQDAMTDESLFPPRCCKQPIPLEKNRLFLDAAVAQQFRDKALEFSTPRRTYCHNHQCAAFIPPTHYDNDVAACERCNRRTCMTCKQASHDGDCPNDEHLGQTLQLAREQGWQRCQNCWGMVELNTGCNHMTCRCGFQFCYVCGAHWKTCGCEQWEERRLYERAVQIDARDQVPEEAVPGEVAPVVAAFQADGSGSDEQEIALDQTVGLGQWPRPPQQPQRHDRQRRVHTLMQSLRRNHECEHQHWFNRKGPRECEECHDVMPIFVYECRQCHIMACRRCRYHRL